MTWQFSALSTGDSALRMEEPSLCKSMPDYGAKAGEASWNLPSMPMAAPKAIQMACSLGRVPLRVLLRMAPAAEPATAPKKPIVRDHAPAEISTVQVHTQTILRPL